MTARAESAPRNTTTLECLIAIIAAIKNVLSPSSDTTITDREATKAWTKPTSNLVSMYLPYGSLAITSLAFLNAT